MKEKDTFLWRMRVDLKQWLEADAKKKGLSLTALMNVISYEYRKQEEKKLKAN